MNEGDKNVTLDMLARAVQPTVNNCIPTPMCRQHL